MSSYPLTKEEKIEVASIMALVEQAQTAQNYLYSQLAKRAADRYDLDIKDVTLNFQDIMEKGANCAELILLEK